MMTICRECFGCLTKLFKKSMKCFSFLPILFTSNIMMLLYYVSGENYLILQSFIFNMSYVAFQRWGTSRTILDFLLRPMPERLI